MCSSNGKHRPVTEIAVGAYVFQLLPIGKRTRWSVRSVVSAHWPFALVLGAGALLRAAVAFAYAPALFYSDSWSYVGLAFSRFPVNIGPLEPSGYPFLIRVLTLPGRRIGIVTSVQHVAGLAIAALVYAMLLRLGTRRWVATLAAAVVVLDGYGITLEQYVMPETFFTLALVGAFFLTLAVRQRPATFAAAGVLLAAATTIRAVGIFAIPIWVLTVLFSRVGGRAKATGLVCLAVPLVAYLAIHAAVHRGFRLTNDEGWLLYSRVGAIADCKGVPSTTRVFCSELPRPRPTTPAFYMFDPQSPARLAFRHGFDNNSNGVLLRFGIATIEHHPGAYLRIVGSDFGRYFSPSGGGIAGPHPPRGTPVDPLTLPDARSPEWASPSAQHDRAAYLPTYKGHEVRAPASILRHYSAVIHTQRWLVGALAVAALAALLAGWLPSTRRFAWHRQPTALLSLSALAMMLGTVAVDYFRVRLLIPSVPLLVCGGAVAGSDWARYIHARFSTNRCE